MRMSRFRDSSAPETAVQWLMRTATHVMLGVCSHSQSFSAIAHSRVEAPRGGISKLSYKKYGTKKLSWSQHLLVVLANMIGAGLSSKVARFFPGSSAAKEPPVEDRSSVPDSEGKVESALDEKPYKDGTVLSTSVDGELEDPTLAPGELSYEEGVCNSSIRRLRPN